MHRLSRLTLLASLTFLVVAPLIAEDRKPVSIDDVYRIDGPTDVAIAADGASAVFIRRWNDRASRSTRFSLWRAVGSADQAQPLEKGEPDVRRFVLSPNGKWIAFLSTRPRPDGSPSVDPLPAYTDVATDIWLMSVEGGRAIPLVGRGKPYGRVFTDPFYAGLTFSPDGKRLAFVADDGVDPRTPAEIENNVQVVRDDQGEGYEGYTAAQIWIADLDDLDWGSGVAARQIRRITNDDVWYGDPQWAPDGKSLVVHANRTDDRESVRYSINKNYDLWRINLADNSLTQLTSGPGPEVSPRFSPDGTQLVCLSIPRKGSHMDCFNLMLIDLETSGPRSRVLFDHHGPEADKPRHLSPSFPLPADCWVSNGKVRFNAMQRTSTPRQVIDVVKNAGVIEDLPSDAAAREKLVPAGNRFLQDRIVAKSEIVRWTSFDGQEVEGVLTRPSKPGAKEPYPLVLRPHGGPHGRSTEGFNLTVQVLAGAGYAVFEPNYRGSSGYGQKWINADRFDLGGGDMRDMLTGIDHLIEQGIADRDRQFVYGISYGGFTTCTLIGQTRQFRAAVPQNAVTDLNAMWGLSDIQSWTEWEFGGRPWEVPQAMRDHSPLTHVANIRTPTLILHAMNDRRCPVPMAKMFYRALKSNGVETQLVLYPDEGHPIKQPPHEQDVLRRVLDWFAAHDRPSAAR